MTRHGIGNQAVESLERRRLLSSTGVEERLAPANCVHGPGCGCGLLWTGTQPAEQWVDLQARESLAVPALSSRPNATAKLYLDFDGDFTPAWGDLSPGSTPAYDTDNDPSSFSVSELSDIRTIFDHVAEAFSIFNLDVTTTNPGNLNDLQTLRVVFGGNGSWFGGAGGVAFVDAFTNGAPNTVWTFSKNLFTPRDNAIVAVHEAGHGFGLLHQSVYDASGNKLEEYNPGDADRGPFMGTSWGARRSMWYDGPNSVSATTYQDDIALISRTDNGFGLAGDDHADTLADATDLGPVAGGASAAGLIHATWDSDMFRFTHTGGPLEVGMYRARDAFRTANGMLDSFMSIKDASGAIVVEAPSFDLDEVIRMPSLPAGTYYAHVGSLGYYGDIGQYTLRFASSIDSTPPEVIATGFDWLAGPAVTYTFNEDVGPSLTPSDVAIYSFSIGRWMPGPIDVSWNAATRTARFELDPASPAGDYYFGLAPRGASDASFNSTTQEYGAWDWLLPGDANRDRTVDFADLLILAQNFGQSGRTFSQGNFDYSPDGLVGFSDLLIVAQNFNQGLLSPNATSRPALSPMRVDREADALLT